MAEGSIQVVVRKNNVATWSARLRTRVAIEVEASAHRTLDAALELVPRRTGELADTGVVNQRGAMSFVVSFGEGLSDGRAIYQEFGTFRHPPQPYLYPAFQAEIPTLVARLAMTTQGRIKIMPGMLGNSAGINTA